MNKSIVRRLAFTLVLVLVLKTFVSDYNSIGVRAENVPENVELTAIEESDDHAGLDSEIDGVEPIDMADAELEAEASADEEPAQEEQVQEEPAQEEEAQPEESQPEEVAPAADEAAEEAVPVENTDVAETPEQTDTPEVQNDADNQADPAAPAETPETPETPAEVAEDETQGEADASAKMGILTAYVCEGPEIPGSDDGFTTFRLSEEAVDLSEYVSGFDAASMAGDKDITDDYNPLTEAFLNWANQVTEGKDINWFKISLGENNDCRVYGVIKTAAEAVETPETTDDDEAQNSETTSGNAEQNADDDDDVLKPAVRNGAQPAVSDGNPAVTDGNPTVSDGNALYTVKVYLREATGPYPTAPSGEYVSTVDYNPFGKATVGESFTINLQEELTDGRTTYLLDMTKHPNKTATIDKVVEDYDGSKNVFEVYYYRSTAVGTDNPVAFYVLLPDKDFPINSDPDSSLKYYPEKGKSYSYEKWHGYAKRDLYTGVPESKKDGQGNVWDVTGNDVKDEIDMDRFPGTKIEEDFANDPLLSKYQVWDGSKFRSVQLDDIQWYVYKNVGEGEHDKQYHIDGYIKGASIRVTYHTNFKNGQPEDSKTTNNLFTGLNYEILGYDVNFGTNVKKDDKGNEYEFVGWTTKDDGKGGFFKPGDHEVLKGNLDLYAAWLPKIDNKIKIKVGIKSDGPGRDTYIKYNGEPHRGNMQVEVTVDSEEIKNSFEKVSGALNSILKAAENAAGKLTGAMALRVSAETGLKAVDDTLDPMNQEFIVPDESVEVEIDKYNITLKVTVSDLRVKGGYGKHVLPDKAGYPIILDTSKAKVKLEGLPVDISDKFEIIIDTGVALGDGDALPTSGVIGNLYILPRDVELISATAEKVYDGTPLQATNVTVGADGYATGDFADYTNFASQTEVGSTQNTFSYALRTTNELEQVYKDLKCSMDLDYNIKAAYGTLTVKDDTKSNNPKKPDKKNKKNKKENPKKNDGGDPSNNDHVDNGNPNDQTVLGAIRPLNGEDGEKAVLGSRRGATEDTTNTARLFVLIGAAAAVAILLFVGKKRRQEEQ